jgi:hypothetical protein
VSRYTRDLRSNIIFTDREGRFVGKVKVREGLSTGTKHINPRRPNGPLCECGEPWAPICSNTRCQGNIVPRRIMRIERYGLRRNERQEVHGGK